MQNFPDGQRQARMNGPTRVNHAKLLSFTYSLECSVRVIEKSSNLNKITSSLEIHSAIRYDPDH